MRLEINTILELNDFDYSQSGNFGGFNTLIKDYDFLSILKN